MKRILGLSALIVIIFMINFMAQAEDTLSIYYSPTSDHHDIIQGIDSAKKSVQMVIFHLADPAVLQALESAHTRGVKVEVIMDRKTLLIPGTGKAKKELEKAGVTVYTSTKGFVITHQKTMVVDDETAYVTTMNLAKSGVQTTRDWGVITNDPGVIQEMDLVFQADVKNSQDNGKVTPQLHESHMVWSPVNAESKLVSLINSAQHTIISTVENLGNKNIHKAFTDAVARGVKVRVISPLCDINIDPRQNIGFSKELFGLGVQAFLMPGKASGSQPYMHAKMIVVDSQRAYLGSVNFSDNSLFSSREAGIIFSNDKAIRTMESEFEKDWAQTLSPIVSLPFCL